MIVLLEKGEGDIKCFFFDWKGSFFFQDFIKSIKIKH